MHKYVVASNQQISPTTVLLTLKNDDGSPLSFQPGQYAAINYYHNSRPTPARCFSIVSSPTEQETLQFSMRTKGHFTSSLRRLGTGDIVQVRGPFGGFVFEQDRDKQSVFIAGGIGITPFMSMMRYASELRLQHHITLLYSCQTQDDVPFMDELKTLSKRNLQLRVVFVIGNGPTSNLAGYNVVNGRIGPDIIRRVINNNPSSQSFFICGPPPFMKSMSHILEDQHVPSHHIMTEAFGQGKNRQTGKIRSWPFNVYVLSAAGVALGSFVVMISDVLKTLPPSTVFGSLSNITSNLISNNRQADLDSLVNGLPASKSNAPASPAAQAAQAQSQSSSSQSNSSSSTSNNNQSSTSSTPAPTTNPTPVKSPVCSTTPSGMMVCQ